MNIDQYTTIAKAKFDTHFPKPHSFITALHSKNLQHALEGAQISYDNGADGVALVTHCINPYEGADIIHAIKQKYPHHQAVLNVLQMDPLKVFQMLENLNVQIDGVWTDNARIHGVDKNANDSDYPNYVREQQAKMGRDGIYFGPVNFKHQAQHSPEELGPVMHKVKPFLDVITTSGPSTGEKANANDVALLKMAAGEHPVGLASGLTPENIHDFIEHHNISIVASGISSDYYNLDPKKVLQLAEHIEKYNRKKLRKEYEKYLLEKYNVPSVEALREFLKQENYINISSWNNDELEKKLSNLYEMPFEFEGVIYASAEAFRMAIKYPESDERRKEIINLSWVKAKFAWYDARFTKVVYYKWKEIPIGSPEHHALFKRALRAKLEQNPDIREALVNSGNRPIVHIPFTRHAQPHVLPDSRTIPAEKFSEIIMELREEFRQS